MSGMINKSGESPFLSTPQIFEEKSEKTNRPKRKLEDGVGSSKSRKVKSGSVQGSSHELKGINIKVSVQKVKERSPKKDLVRDKIVNELFKHFEKDFPNKDELQLNLEMNLINFNKETHTFAVGNHLVLVSKETPDQSVIIAVTNIANKSFARGAFGKIYSVKILGSEENDLALKLSKKKRNKDQSDSTEPSKRGERAKASIEHEIKIMNYMRENAPRLVGLNVAVFGKVNFNHQLGYFINRYDYDGIEFFNKYELPPEVCYEFMANMKMGMKTMHDLDLVHRDIKLDNVLVKKKNSPHPAQFPSYHVALTDFGNAIHLDDLFVDSPYPTLNRILGNGTFCYISEKYVDELDDCLTYLKEFKQEDEKYTTIVKTIKNLLKKNDEFATAVSLYMFWTTKNPPFDSFRDNEYFSFEEGLANEGKDEKLEEMEQELKSVSMHYSKKKFGDENHIALSIMKPIDYGLS